MNPLSILLVALSMSTDAFAAAVAKGTALDRPQWREAFRTGLIFGSIEGATPLIGWAAGRAASGYIAAFDHWVAFVLLAGIGASARFSSSGRYFAAPLPSRETWGLLILDRQERRVYRSAEVGEFWELDEFSDEAISGRHSPLVGNQSYRMALADLLHQSEVVDLIAVADLWLEPAFCSTTMSDISEVIFP